MGRLAITGVACEGRSGRTAGSQVSRPSQPRTSRRPWRCSQPGPQTRHFSAARSGSIRRRDARRGGPDIQGLRRPLVLLSSAGYVLWANDLAKAEHISPEELAGRPGRGLLSTRTRGTPSCARSTSAPTRRTVVRTIVFRQARSQSS